MDQSIVVDQFVLRLKEQQSTLMQKSYIIRNLREVTHNMCRKENAAFLALNKV